MREVTIQLYKFDELSEDAKRSAIENWRNNMDYFHESLLITEYFEEQLVERGYPRNDLEWSLNYSQGDGVAFYGDVDLDKLVDVFKSEGYNLDTDLYEHIINEGLTISATLYRNSFGYHYSHWNTMEVEIDGDHIDTIVEHLTDEEDTDSDEYVETYGEVENLFIDLENTIYDDVRSFSKKLEKDGYSDMRYYSSDEVISEVLISNGYEFTIDGERY